MKNTVDGTNRRLDTIEEKISEPEHLSVEIIQNDTHRKEKKKKKARQNNQGQSVSELGSTPKV